MYYAILYGDNRLCFFCYFIRTVGEINIIGYPKYFLRTRYRAYGITILIIHKDNVYSIISVVAIANMLVLVIFNPSCSVKLQKKSKKWAFYYHKLLISKLMDAKSWIM